MNARSLFIIVFILVTSTFAHNEFYKVDNFKLVLTNSAPFVHWKSNQVTLLLQFTKSTIPTELDYDETKVEFKNGYKVWEDASCFDFIEGTYDGVECGFTTNDAIFDDPANDGGVTKLAIESDEWLNDYIVESTNFPRTTVYDSQVAFNNTVYKNFRWTNAIVFPYGYTWTHFQSIVVHELGHLLGLNHCTKSEATMYYKYYNNTYDFITLTDYDKTGIQIVCAQNPAAPLEINPVSRYINKQNYFYEHEPEVLFNPQEKFEETNKHKEIPVQTISSNSENKQLIKPDNIKIERGNK